MITKYKRKPIEVEAVQYLGFNVEEIEDFINSRVFRYHSNENDSGSLIGTMLHGDIITKICLGDYIVKDTSGEIYIYEPSMFKLLYEV